MVCGVSREYLNLRFLTSWEALGQEIMEGGYSGITLGGIVDSGASNAVWVAVVTRAVDAIVRQRVSDAVEPARLLSQIHKVVVVVPLLPERVT